LAHRIQQKDPSFELDGRSNGIYLSKASHGHWDDGSLALLPLNGSRLLKKLLVISAEDYEGISGTVFEPATARGWSDVDPMHWPARDMLLHQVGQTCMRSFGYSPHETHAGSEVLARLWQQANIHPHP
jgi:hypothetical protein